MVSKTLLRTAQKLGVRQRHYFCGLVRGNTPDQSATAFHVRHHCKGAGRRKTLKSAPLVILFRRDVANHRGLTVIVFFGFDSQ